MEISIENRDKIIALLREGTCPICGKKGFKIPLVHVARAHGISRTEIKSMILLGQRNGFLDPEYRKRKTEYAQKQNILSQFKGKPQKFSSVDGSKAISYSAKKRYKAGLIPLNKGNPDIDSIKKAQRKAIIGVNYDGDTIKYASIKEAAEAHGVTITAISNCLRGKSKTCAGCKWQYIKKE